MDGDGLRVTHVESREDLNVGCLVGKLVGEVLTTRMSQLYIYNLSRYSVDGAKKNLLDS